ncbi:trypsin-like peptidase domain-containing protein [Pseudothioclava nitratireducens]|uniref:trypsin-like peptidase domain-containing protein n=1 Tax=Pseudothioclava nitratireducens TaxID=1928646 RepID=UPI0023DC19A6|nr:trypsin-like peptidase domain-containing protein [Defluviimonas nitratireducens]MDF1619625.1 trypsin-like peptidase domain-containing protein [Defluviimonas nitratireducens]
MKSARRTVSAIVGACLTGMIWTGMGWAEPAWVQIEARSSLREAQTRASEWAETFPDVTGYAMSTGWYAIAIGPFDSPEAAEARLRVLRGERLIPNDSYISDGRRFGQQFWPVGANLAPATQTPETAAPETTTTETAAPAEAAPVAAPEPVAPVEALADSRRLEAALTREERMEIQAALQWQGFYTSAIDGAFGRGTRGSIAAWQTANGFEATGVLASAQQAALLDAVARERAELGLTTVTEGEAGIEIELPMGLIEFDHYDPPFVHYRAKDGSGVRVLLLSQQGDQTTLFGLYDAMQTLEIVPVEGPRERSRSGFTLTGKNDKIHSFTEAELKGGLIKGFTLVYPAGDETRMARVLEAMQKSFTPLGDKALDDTLGQPLAVSGEALMAGLNVRKPLFARSGFYLNAEGAVLTAAAGLEQCSRVSIEDHEATIAWRDAALGIAVLTPADPLAPAAVAKFQIEQSRPGASLAIAGFSYPETLSAPVLSFGTLSDLEGLAGEQTQARLAAATLDGDAGGPVFDATGSVIGILLPKAHIAGKRLPDDLSVAVQATAIAPALAEAGFAPVASDRSGSLAAEDLTEIAQDLVIQIACWE